MTLDDIPADKAYFLIKPQTHAHAKDMVFFAGMMTALYSDAPQALILRTCLPTFFV